MQRIFPIVSMLLLLTLVGTVGFRLVDPSASWLDCLYMAVITLSTVGYGETINVDNNPAGKVFVIVFIVCGLGVFTYNALLLVQWIVSLQMRSIWERRRMEKSINKLHDHFIVCGLGRMGTIICASLADRKKPFVVIDVDEERLVETCEERG